MTWWTLFLTLQLVFCSFHAARTATLQQPQEPKSRTPSADPTPGPPIQSAAAQRCSCMAVAAATSSLCSSSQRWASACRSVCASGARACQPCSAVTPAGPFLPPPLPVPVGPAVMLPAPWSQNPARPAAPAGHAAGWTCAGWRRGRPAANPGTVVWQRGSDWRLSTQHKSRIWLEWRHLGSAAKVTSSLTSRYALASWNSRAGSSLSSAAR